MILLFIDNHKRPKNQYIQGVLIVMKKIVQGLAIGGFAIVLTACQSDDSETVVETEYGSISKEEFHAATADIEITDEEIETHYERMQEERKARHILVDEKETAEEIIKKYKDGASFEELAKEYSKDGSAANGGDLGYTTAGEMVKPFEDAMYGLETNEISEPVESQFGWHVILVEDVRESETEVQPFDEMKDQLREQLLASKVDSQSYTSKVQEALDNGNIDISDDDYEGLFGSNKSGESESTDDEGDSSNEDNGKQDSEEAKDDSESDNE